MTQEKKPTPISVDVLAMMVFRLAHGLRKAAPGNDIAEPALDYLARYGRTGTVFRGNSAFVPDDVPAGMKPSMASDAVGTSASASQPKNVPVPAEVIGLLEALESMVDVCEGRDFDGAPSDAHMEKARAAITTYRAALDATPAAMERTCGVCGADEAFTGTCGGGRANPTALCFEGAVATAIPAAAAPSLISSLKSILADADVGPPTDSQWCCKECGRWTPWHHPEAHDHEEGCTAPREYAKRRDWKSRLSTLIAATPEAATATGLPAQAFQQRVQPWMMACFGPEISADTRERNHRFLEEALELVQCLGCTASEAHQLVDYVYGRPWGEPAQEVGGVMVTLAALCQASRLDMHACGETELARIWTKVEAIRAKQAAKPKHSPLPMHVPELQADAQDADGLYYLQDARWSAMVGNCPSFWRLGGGYTTNLDDAERFTLEAAMKQHKCRETDLPWLCSELDKLRRPTVDCQYMPRSWDSQRESIAAAKGK